MAFGRFGVDIGVGRAFGAFGGGLRGVRAVFGFQGRLALGLWGGFLIGMLKTPGLLWYK